MIRINLLNSAVETTNIDVVENVISHRGTQQTVLVLLAAGACLLAIGMDWIVTKRDNSRVRAEVDTEQATADRLVPLTRQAKELQDKNKAVEERINAIMRLRAEQTGPLRLLQMMDGRLPADGLFRLTSITQLKNDKDPNGEDQFTIMGYSPNESQVTVFARNLEFSDGWFTRFTLETVRIQNPEIAKDVPAAAKVKDLPKEVVRFTIKCVYAPQNLLINPAPQAPPQSAQLTQPAQPSQPAQPPPVANKTQ